MAGIFDKLKEQLELLEWPDVYMFKFITPSSNENTAKIHALFDDAVDIVQKESSSNKYTVFTIKTVMVSAEAVIEIYEKASKIKGVVSL